MIATTTLSLLREPERAATLLNPLRIRLLGYLRQPDSASGLARRLGLPRQRVNYHLRELEKEELVELVEERKKGNCVERLLRASARSYLISPEALGDLAADPAQLTDRFSWAYLAATAARAIHDLGELRARADAAGKRLATMTMESEVRFATASARESFARELSQAVASLVAKYHDEKAARGRRFKLMLGVYPAIKRTSQKRDSKETADQELTDD